MNDKEMTVRELLAHLQSLPENVMDHTVRAYEGEMTGIIIEGPLLVAYIYNDGTMDVVFRKPEPHMPAELVQRMEFVMQGLPANIRKWLQGNRLAGLISKTHKAEAEAKKESESTEE